MYVTKHFRKPKKNILKSTYFFYLPGRAIWTKHYRNGVELPEIARDDNYDFNFQVRWK